MNEQIFSPSREGHGGEKMTDDNEESSDQLTNDLE